MNYLKNLFKSTEKTNETQKNLGNSQKTEDNSVFGFIFQNLETFLLLGMGFLIYALFNTFTSYIAKNASFIEDADRWAFAQTLIFGLMGVEVLLSLATSYFRKRNEWAKSFIVTAVAFIITYYNHTTINEIFLGLPATSQGVQIKLILCNWLIFGLGEIVSLLMNSKGQDLQKQENTPITELANLLKTLIPSPTTHTQTGTGKSNIIENLTQQDLQTYQVKAEAEEQAQPPHTKIVGFISSVAKAELEKSPYSGKGNEEVKNEIFKWKAQNPKMKNREIAVKVNKDVSYVSKTLNGKI